MKSYRLPSFILFLVLSLFMATSVAATDGLAASSSASPSVRPRFENRRNAVEEKQEEAKERQESRKENREERQEQRLETRDEFLKRVADRVERRFKSHEQRLENWIGRATKRLTTLSAEGKNTTAAKAALDKTKLSLANATTLGEQAVTLLRSVSAESWDAQKTEALAARAAVNKAQVAFAQVVKDMQATLKELKALQES